MHALEFDLQIDPEDIRATLAGSSVLSAKTARWYGPDTWFTLSSGDMVNTFCKLGAHLEVPRCLGEHRQPWINVCSLLPITTARPFRWQSSVGDSLSAGPQPKC